jgi:hypothetical protein
MAIENIDDPAIQHTMNVEKMIPNGRPSNSSSSPSSAFESVVNAGVLKKEDELAVLLIDKKDNADGEKVINFYTQEQALGQQQYLNGHEFESDASRQLKNIATLDLKPKIELTT